MLLVLDTHFINVPGATSNNTISCLTVKYKIYISMGYARVIARALSFPLATSLNMQALLRLNELPFIATTTRNDLPCNKV